MRRVVVLTLVLACTKHDAREQSKHIDDAPLAAIQDAARVDAAPPVDAAPAHPAPPDAARADAGVPPRKQPTKKRSRRDACYEQCRRRDMNTHCADETGMVSCPCNCP